MREFISLLRRRFCLARFAPPSWLRTTRRSDVVGRALARSDDGGAANDRVFLVSKINRRRYDGDGVGDGDDDDGRPKRREAKREPSNGDVAHVIRVRARGG